MDGCVLPRSHLLRAPHRAATLSVSEKDVAKAVTLIQNTSKIFMTGNPTFEVMRHFQPQIQASDVVKRMKLTPKEYVLVTAHRSENVDNPEYLAQMFKAFGGIAKRLNKHVLYPMHPRTKSKMKGVDVPKGVEIINPLGFYDFN